MKISVWPQSKRVRIRCFSSLVLFVGFYSLFLLARRVYSLYKFMYLYIVFIAVVSVCCFYMLFGSLYYYTKTIIYNQTHVFVIFVVSVVFAVCCLVIDEWSFVIDYFTLIFDDCLLMVHVWWLMIDGWWFMIDEWWLIIDD